MILYTTRSASSGLSCDLHLKRQLALGVAVDVPARTITGFDMTEHYATQRYAQSQHVHVWLGPLWLHVELVKEYEEPA